MAFPSDHVDRALLHHAGFIRSLAYSLLADEHAAEDAVQQTYLAALEQDAGRPVHDVRAWAARVLRRAANRFRRNEVRRTRREQEVAARTETTSPPADESVAHAETLQRLTDAVVSLDEPYRSTILFRYFEGLTPTEIGAREGVPVATVKSRLRRGLDKVRARLDRDHDGRREGWAGGLLALCGHGNDVALAAAAKTLAATTPTLAGTSAPAALAVKAGVFMTTKHLVPVAALLFSLGIATLAWGPWSDSGHDISAPGIEPSTELADRVTAAAGVSGVETTSAPGTRTPIAATGGLRGRVRWSDGTPAARVGVWILPWGSEHARLDKTHVVTDEQGRFAVNGLPPGSVGCRGDRGGHARVLVEAGKTAQVEFRIPAGFSVLCQVVDASQTPVAGAEVWVEDAGAQGCILGQTDRLGQFLARDLSNPLSLGARHADHGPSYNRSLSRIRPGTTKELRFVLPGRGAGLEVLVLDSAGDPVARALVEITGEGKVETSRPTDARRPSAYQLKTDPGGRVRAPCLTPGRARIAVAAHRDAPAERTIEVVPGRGNTCTVRLGMGVRIRGTARDMDGEPLPGVSVSVRGPLFAGERRTQADDRGEFDLPNVAAGQFEIRATAAGYGNVLASLSGDEGEVLEWHPVFDPGRVLAGRLLDERGSPLAGWRVQVKLAVVPVPDRGKDRDFQGNTVTGEDGRFRVPRCPTGALVLDVFTPLDQKGVACHGRWPAVHADGVAREYTIPDRWRPTAFVSGRVVDQAGRPVAARVVLQRRADEVFTHLDPAFPVRTWNDPGSGRFRLGPVAPARYDVGITCDEHRRGLPTIELAPGETLDLGDIRAQDTGRIAFDLEFAEGVDPKDYFISTHPMIPDSGGGPTPPRVAHRVAPFTLAAGVHVVRITGPGMSDRLEVVVEPGKTCTIRRTLRPGARLGLWLTDPRDDKIPDRVQLVVKGLDGEVLEDAEVRVTNRVISHDVPPNVSLRVEVRTEDGRFGTAEVPPQPIAGKGRRPAPTRVILDRR